MLVGPAKATSGSPGGGWGADDVHQTHGVRGGGMVHSFSSTRRELHIRTDCREGGPRLPQHIRSLWVLPRTSFSHISGHTFFYSVEGLWGELARDVGSYFSLAIILLSESCKVKSELNTFVKVRKAKPTTFSPRPMANPRTATKPSSPERVLGCFGFAQRVHGV